MLPKEITITKENQMNLEKIFANGTIGDWIREKVVN